MLTVDTMRNFGIARARRDVLVSLVIAPDRIASARRVEAAVGGQSVIAPQAL
jgi:hypothetical protein